MATNYIQPGDTVTITAPSGGTTAGVGVLTGSLFGVALSTAAVGESVAIGCEGVYKLAKQGTDTFSIGAIAYWNNTNKTVTSTTTSNQKIGIIVNATVGSGDATAQVRLIPDSLQAGAGAEYDLARFN